MLSCKKDADSQPPEVFLTSPGNNIVFSVFDTIVVSGNARDEHKLASLEIVLVDRDGSPALEPISIETNTPGVSFTRNYLLNDIHLTSGVYRIKATAFDGVNRTSVYREIIVNEIKKTRKAILMLTAGNGKTDVYRLDSLPGFTYLLSSPGDFSASAVSSWYQQLYTGGKYNGNFNVFSMEDLSVNWSISPLVSSAPFFTGVYTDEKNCYVSFYDGAIASYDSRGQQTRLFVSMTENAHPYKCCKLKEFMVMEELDVTLTTRKLVAFYLPTGKYKQEWPLKPEVIAFFPKGESELFIFGNEQGQGSILIYDALKNYTWNPYSNFPAGKILSVARIDETTFLIGHENNMVYKYQFSGSGLLPLITGARAECMDFDEVNSEIIFAKNKQVWVYSYPVASMLRTESLPDSVMAVHTLFNK